MTPNEFKPLPALELTRGYAPPLNANVFSGSDEESEEVRVPLSHYLWILKRYRWKILTFCVVVLIATLMVSLRLTPVYEATATIDIDRQTPSDVVGQDSVRSTPGDADQFLATQMKLVESDSVLRPVDQKYGLRKLEGQSSADGSAKGNAAPVMLKQLKVTRPPNTYLMLINYQSTDPQLAADAANAISQSYLEHTYNIRVNSSASMAGFMERQLEELKTKMERSGMALAAFERELNLVNPEEKTNIVASRLLQLNTDYTSAQSERLKKEAANDSVKGGVLEAVLATPQGDALRKLSERANEAREHFAEIKAYYGTNHPEYRRAQATLDQIQVAFDATKADVMRRVEIEFQESERREQMAGEAVATAKAEFDKINSRSFEYQSLKREADGDKTLYDELMRRIKEAGINAGFHNSAIRIADAARPPLKPVFPNIPLNLLLGVLFAGLLGIGGAVIADLLDKTIRDPEQVSRTLRTEVIGSLPLMKGGGERRMLASNVGESEAAVQERESSGFAESVRTLRNSILLANVNNRYRSLLVTSAAPSEGKTTTAAHLAAAHAEQGQRTLLIDGDLRRPSVHRNFNLPSSLGLSNVLLGELPWREAVITVENIPSLDVLPAGPPSRRAGDLVGRGIVELLEEAISQYDLVILDAPPLLGFAEPLQMATAVDGVIIVARAGQTSRKAVASVIATLNRLRANVIGLVLNEVHKNLSDSYYYYGYYRSYYRPIEEEGTETAKQKGAAA